jgi:Ca2+-binding EF-hand superfamily protein
LIALGLVQNRQQVEEIIYEVDTDGTGEIEFEEFLTIISMGKNKKKYSSQNQQQSNKDDEKNNHLGAIVDW